MNFSITQRCQWDILNVKRHTERKALAIQLQTFECYVARSTVGSFQQRRVVTEGIQGDRLHGNEVKTTMVQFLPVSIYLLVENMPQGFVLEYVALYLQIIRCRVADHIICIAVGECIFPDAPHAQRDMDVSDLFTPGKRVCAYLGNPFFKSEFLNMVFADIPR